VTELPVRGALMCPSGAVATMAPVAIRAKSAFRLQ
jgi:hypothetical protein